MKPFLKTVAEAYSARYGKKITDILFVFPNKRSATFFTKYLTAEARETILAPECLPISDFIGQLAGRIVDSHTDLLFLLHRCYTGLVDKSAKAPEAEFDRFRGWGETVLSDFDEVDMQLVEPSEIFKNVRDFRSISSNFLTEEQRRVMEEYFGYSGPAEDPASFWKEFGNPEEGSGENPRTKFVYLWQVLAPLYDAFQAELERQDLTTPGGAYRLAFEAVKALTEALDTEEALLQAGLADARKIVFVGFNALTRSEHRIFTLLRRLRSRFPGEDEPYAEFFWDAVGPLLRDEDNPAGHFISHNRRYLPSPRWAEPYLQQAETDSIPETQVYSVPSNVAQMKVIGGQLGEMMARGKFGEKELKDARVAVVLPDESLLQNLLYSLPEEVGNPNLTMGYPLKQTPVISFLQLLKLLQIKQRNNGEGFFFQDVKRFLSHPYCQTLFGIAPISRFLTRIANEHRYVVTPAEIAQLGETAAEIMRPIARDTAPMDVIAYLEGVLARIDASLHERGNALLKGNLEHENITTCRDKLRILSDCLRRYDIAMHFSTVFLLAARLIAGETVPFEGEPLKGLQVMGMLETRCLDFDWLFIPSLNDKTMPRRARKRTFIPNSLRRAYGMPPANCQESLFAYYFFRLLSRAKHACLLYDSRTGDNGGGVSRFILQLRHLLARDHISTTECRYSLASAKPYDVEVEKDDQVRSRLAMYLDPESGRRLSASSLNTFANCPMRFFYENILRLGTDPEPQEAIDAITTGNIIHAVMMNVYLPVDLQGKFLSEPFAVSEEFVRAWLDDRPRLERLVRRMINREHFHLPEAELDRELTGSAANVFGQFVDQVSKVLRRDLRLAPFNIYGCEVEGTLRLPFGMNGLEGETSGETNIRFFIDRIDDAETGGERLRIVDYKTGGVYLEAELIEALFTGDSKQNFQLFFYAEMLGRWLKENLPGFPAEMADPAGMRLEIYNVTAMERERKPFLPKIGGVSLREPGNWMDIFRQELDVMLQRLFDPETRFEMTENRAHCRYCPLRHLCRR